MIRTSQPKYIITSHTSMPSYQYTYICILLPASLKPQRYQGDLDRHDRALRCRFRIPPSIAQADPVPDQVLLGGCQSRRKARIRCLRTMHPRPETLVSVVQPSILTNRMCGPHQFLLHREQIVHTGVVSALDPLGHQDNSATDIEVTPLPASYTSSSSFESCTSAGSCTLHE